MSELKLVKKTPIWRFYYKGSHSHPVRKVVAVTERKGSVVTGYELRSGNVITATLDSAPIKSYSLSRIAKIRSIDKRLSVRKEAGQSRLNESTLRKDNLISVLTEGV